MSASTECNAPKMSLPPYTVNVYMLHEIEVQIIRKAWTKNKYQCWPRTFKPRIYWLHSNYTGSTLLTIHLQTIAKTVLTRPCHHSAMLEASFKVTILAKHGVQCIWNILTEDGLCALQFLIKTGCMKIMFINLEKILIYQKTVHFFWKSRIYPVCQNID